MAKTYGWTPQQVDECDAELIDWLIAIQGVEGELTEEAQKKQVAEAKRMSKQRRPPRR